MPEHSLLLKNHVSTLNKSVNVYGSKGFIFKNGKDKFIVSIHHFMPVVKTSLDINSENVELKKFKDIYWNELNIFECPDKKYLHNTIEITDINTRFLNEKEIIKLKIGNNEYKFPCIDYKNHFPNRLSVLKNIYMRFSIGREIENNKFYLENDKTLTNVSVFRSLSGSPVFSNDNKLIGIFCKFEINDKNIYGWVLPVIYLIKSISKINNRNIYTIDINHYENIKIGQYEVQKNQKDNRLYIYYLPVQYKLELDVFFYLEGDKQKSLQITDTNNIIKEVNFQIYDNFDISLPLEKKDNLIKLNTGLYTLLIKNNFITENDLNERYKNILKLNDIWISFNNFDHINMARLKIS